MLDTLLSMLSILAAWAAWGGAFVALGAMMLPTGLCGRREFDLEIASGGADRGDGGLRLGDRALRLLVWFWTGWCGAILFLQVWHLWLPVDIWAAGIFWGVAFAAALYRRRLLLDALVCVRRSRSTLVIAGAIALLWANLATGEIHNPDTGLYHLQAARWNAAHGIVPGLGNLHGRLAYNNSSLLYAALVDVGSWSHRGHHIANGLLTLGLLLPLVASIPRALRGATMGDGEATDDWPSHVFRSLLIVPAALLAYKHATSLSPDLPAALLGIVVGVVLIDLCVQRAATFDRDARDGGAAFNSTAVVGFVALVAATSVTVKLSMMATGGVATVVALWLTRGSGRRPAVRWLLAAAFFVAAVGPWCVRGAILSGYIAYPSQVVALDVAWRVPREWAEEDRRTIVAWARDPTRSADDVLADSRWIGPWFARQARDVLGVTLPMAIALASAVALVRKRRRGKQRGDELRRRPGSRLGSRLWPATLPFFASVAFLLATAPNLSRFGGGSMWILGVVAVTAWLDEQRRTAAEPFRRAGRVVVVVVAALAILTVGKIGRYVRVRGGLAPIPRAELRTDRTDSGLELNVPTDSDRAWDAPLPSTPYPKPQLTERREGDLGAGFEHRK